MNDLEKTEESGKLGKAQVPALNGGRRRWLRGAVSVAPVVLTLRSGALAAASCTGVKVVSVQTNVNGQIPSGTNAAAGDYCVTNVETVSCTGQKIASGGDGGILRHQNEEQGTGPLRCDNVSSRQTVAIASFSSAQSLGIA